MSEDLGDGSLRIGDEELPARYADSLLSQTRGHMFRARRPEYALVFPFGDVGMQSLHMMFVPFALDAVYVIDGIVQKVSRLRPWIGLSWGVADTIIELPSGAFAVSEGDEVAL